MSVLAGEVALPSRLLASCVMVSHAAISSTGTVQTGNRACDDGETTECVVFASVTASASIEEATAESLSVAVLMTTGDAP